MQFWKVDAPIGVVCEGLLCRVKFTEQAKMQGMTLRSARFFTLVNLVKGTRTVATAIGGPKPTEKWFLCLRLAGI